MILVRDVFRLKFGKAKDAVAVWKEGVPVFRKISGGSEPRFLTDLVGEYYTLILESTYPSLADFERLGKSTSGDPQWREWYQKFLPLVEGGHREIFTIVE